MARNTIAIIALGLVFAAIATGATLALVGAGDQREPILGSMSEDIEPEPRALARAPLAEGPQLVPGSVVEASFNAGPLPGPEPRLVGSVQPFRDPFDRLRRDRWKVSHGWRNGEWTANDWRRSQAVFDKGVTLTLEPSKSSLADFAGAEIQSRKRFGHGYFEVRMRAAKASGTVSGFFTYTGPPFGDPWNEIDIEILGSKPREVMFTYFRDGEKMVKKMRLEFDATEEFHTYGFDWQPEHLHWYVDGKRVHSAAPAELALPNLKQKLMISLWGSESLTSWVGPFDPNTLPTRMTVACISYSEDYASRQSCDED